MLPEGAGCLRGQHEGIFVRCLPAFRPDREARGEKKSRSYRTYLVDHVRQQTLYLIPLHLSSPLADPHRGNEFSQPHLPDLPIVLPFLVFTYLPQQVPKTEIPPPFKREVDASLHKVGLPSCERGVEGVQGAETDGAYERREERGEVGVRAEEVGRGEGMCC